MPIYNVLYNHNMVTVTYKIEKKINITKNPYVELFPKC